MLKKKVAKLRVEVKKQQDSRMCMEGALTYVEDQLATLQAALTLIAPTPPIVYLTLLINTPVPANAPTFVAPASTHIATVPSSVVLDSSTPLETKPTSERSHVARIIKILDPNQFYADKAKDDISYEDWHLQMLGKMTINALTMPTKAAKHDYVQSQTGGHALAQLKPRLRLSAANFF